MTAVDRVRLDSGLISGTRSADGRVAAFKGIPYAAAPVGDLRWRPPRDPEPWSGTRPADRFGPRCTQPSRAPTSIGYWGPAEESEDCLYLNVWTAAEAPDERRPVMVWFHGGAFYLGSASLPLFDGEALARRGVVVVTVNYRLGRLGFLAHPALSRESENGTSGNYGLLDQIAALAWVRRNIAGFGGDAGRVTAFGQSAGSISIACHMASPLATGLFQRAIGQSGGAFGPVGETSNTGDSMQSLEAAERSGLEWAQRSGAAGLDDLRGLSADAVQLPSGAPEPVDPSKAGRGDFDTSFPIVDGHAVPQSPFVVFSEGRQHALPLITGFVANEAATMPAAADLASHEAQARAEFGGLAERFLTLFAAGSDAEARGASQEAFGYRNFMWQNRTFARLHAEQGAPVFHYRFEQAPPIPTEMDYYENAAAKFGAFHGSEIPYIFGTFAARPWPWREADHDIAEIIASYWVSFAASGDPNGGSLPQWPRFDPQHPTDLRIGEGARPPSEHEAKIAFWNAWFEQQRGRAPS